MKDILFETKNLYVRPIGDDDLIALRAIWADHDVMFFSVSGVKTDNQIKEMILSSRNEYLNTGLGRWAVVHKRFNQLIGECGIAAQEIDGHQEYEIGYRFNKSYWGKGYATEAASACKALGFNQFGMQRLISIIDPKNLASIRVAEKIGMKREKETVFHDIPVLIYSLNCDGKIRVGKT